MEYVIWGKVAGKTDPLDEVPLYTRCTSMEQCKGMMAYLAEKHGCHSMRVQVLDGTPPDFTKAIA
jgi:hypothetical protein